MSLQAWANVRRGQFMLDVDLTFEEAVFGTEKPVQVQRMERCSHCKGGRAEPGTQVSKCTACNGSGEVRRVQQSIFGQFVNVSVCPRCEGEGSTVSEPCRSRVSSLAMRRASRGQLSTCGGDDTEALVNEATWVFIGDLLALSAIQIREGDGAC